MPAPVPLDYARPRESSKAPFSLPSVLEVTAVLVLLMLACAAVVPKYGCDHKGARIAAARADIENFTSALSAFDQDVGTYPTAAEGLAALIDPPGSAYGWNGPYLSRRPAIDPWGSRYVYVPGAGPTPPHVISVGPDGVQGTADDIAPM